LPARPPAHEEADGVTRRPLVGGALVAALAALAWLLLVVLPSPGAQGSSANPSEPTEGPTPSAAATRPGSSAPALSPTPTPASGVPDFRHVYLIVMENHGYESIVGSASAPYLNSLIAQYGLATAYHSVGSPSLPNYLALFSGSTQGVTDDGSHDIGGSNLADQLEAAGHSWSVFAQNVPPGCFTGESASGGADGSGTYARKHNPALSFTDISMDPARCARITDFSHFDPAAADFALIIPNLCDDMHDCSVANGDAFLQSFVPKITDSSAFADSVLFITWDEGSGDDHVATLVLSPLVLAGTRSSVGHTHYSLLRTIEDAWGLGCLNETCTANNLREFFAR
jgi:hypothetical protein